MTRMLLCMAFLLLSSFARADKTITWMGPGVSRDTAPMEYTLEELIEQVQIVYGEELADAMRADFFPPEPPPGEEEQEPRITVLELYSPDYAEGASDDDTIFINTRPRNRNDVFSVFYCAMLLVHEYEHATRPRDPEDPDPDPLTTGPCGDCYHAAMHVNAMSDLRSFIGEDCADYEGPPAKKDVCDSIRGNIYAAEKYLRICSDDPLCEETSGAAETRQTFNAVISYLEYCCE